MALAPSQMAIAARGGCHPGIYTPVRGYYIYTRWHPTLSVRPLPQCVTPPASCMGNQGSPPPAFNTLSDSGDGYSTGRGAWGVLRNTQRFLASYGLEYISTRLLVYLSSRMLDFRAA